MPYRKAAPMRKCYTLGPSELERAIRDYLTEYEDVKNLEDEDITVQLSVIDDPSIGFYVSQTETSVTWGSPK